MMTHVITHSFLEEKGWERRLMYLWCVLLNTAQCNIDNLTVVCRLLAWPYGPYLLTGRATNWVRRSSSLVTLGAPTVPMHALSRILRRNPSGAEDACPMPTGGSCVKHDKERNEESKPRNRPGTRRPTRMPTPTTALIPPPNLAAYIANEKWDAVRELLSDPNANFLVRSCYYPDNHNSSISIHDNALHYACRFYPPVDVVKLIHLANPEYITQVDSAGRTVLHTAIRYGGNPRTVRYLGAKYPSAVGALDLANQTPLHYLCRHYGASHDPIKSRGDKAECMFEIVRALFANSPKQTVNVESEDGCTALEWAIETGAPYKLVKFLQKACQTDWREASDSSGLDHEALKQVLHDQAIKSQHKLSIEIERTSSRRMMRGSTTPSTSSPSIFDMAPIPAEPYDPTLHTQLLQQASTSKSSSLLNMVPIPGAPTRRTSMPQQA